MSSLVIDTHAAIWYFLKSSRLSGHARAAINEAILAGDNIYLASITLVEVVYLFEKGKLTSIALNQLFNEIKNSSSRWILMPLDLEIAQTVAKIPRDLVPDMPDRIIASTALHLDLPLITCDEKICASRLITTIW